jgi:hypothetical protein
MKTELFKCETGNTKTGGHFLQAFNKTCSEAFHLFNGYFLQQFMFVSLICLSVTSTQHKQHTGVCR